MSYARPWIDFREVLEQKQRLVRIYRRLREVEVRTQAAGRFVDHSQGLLCGFHNSLMLVSEPDLSEPTT